MSSPTNLARWKVPPTYPSDESVAPVVLPARNIPMALRPRVKKELDRMISLGVISPIDEPTDWVSQVVVVERKPADRVRLCIDPRPLNKALQREHHHLQTLDEILPELGKAKIFAKFDLRSGYWHVPLDEASRKLTCCQTPFGRFVWNRLPFGLKVSSELFAKRVHAAISDLLGSIASPMMFSSPVQVKTSTLPEPPWTTTPTVSSNAVWKKVLYSILTNWNMVSRLFLSWAIS